MAYTYDKPGGLSILRTIEVIRLKRKEISAIYFFAILNGLLQLSIPLGIQSIINFLQAFTFSTSIWILIMLVLVGVFLSGALQVSQLKVIERINQKLFSRYGLEFAYRIPRFDVMKVDKYYLPEQVNRFFDTVSIQKGLGKLLLDIPTASIQILFGLILLSFYSSVFILFGILLLIILILIISLTSKKGLVTSLVESEYKYNVAGWLEELARSFKTFKFNNLTNLHLKKSDQLMEGYLVARTSHFKILLVQYWALIIFKVLITAAMLIVGALLTINNKINLGQFVAAEIVIITIMASVEKFIFSLDNVYDLLTSIEKIGKVLDKPMDKYGALPFQQKSTGINLKLNNVSFKFDDEVEVIRNVSFNIPAGAKVCLMGDEGAGKTMLLKLLTGCYNNYRGVILFENIPLSNIKQDTMQQHLGVVFSNQDIFTATMLENLTMGRQDFSFDNLTQLARLTELEDYLKKLPQGYETMMDVGGKRLSKSTRQKILIIRALLHNPALLLLENPWSALSPHLIVKIQEYVLNQMPATTTLMITKEESFASQCDYIIKMANGEVINITPGQQKLN